MKIDQNLPLICAAMVHQHALVAIEKKDPAGWNRLELVKLVGWWCKDLEAVQAIADQLEDFIKKETKK